MNLIYKTHTEDLSSCETTLENRYWFKKEFIKTSCGKIEKTYRIDEAIRGIDPKSYIQLQLMNTTTF